MPLDPCCPGLVRQQSRKRRISGWLKRSKSSGWSAHLRCGGLVSLKLHLSHLYLARLSSQHGTRLLRMSYLRVSLRLRLSRRLRHREFVHCQRLVLIKLTP